MHLRITNILLVPFNKYLLKQTSKTHLERFRKKVVFYLSETFTVFLIMYEELLQHDPFIEWHICKKNWKLTLCKVLKLLEPLQNQCFNNHHSLWFSTHVFHDTQAWLGGTPTKNPRTHNDQTYSSAASHNAKHYTKNEVKQSRCSGDILSWGIDLFDWLTQF